MGQLGRDGEGTDPVSQAQISGLRTVLCLLQSECGPLSLSQRTELLRAARGYARTSTLVTSYLLDEALTQVG
ncbi:hypothetical protein DIZ27_37260 [Streptomyces sp. NWU339]|nr:hypothetical protein DIZ27_37260 [Streptomyces sp. NWU339]